MRTPRLVALVLTALSCLSLRPATAHAQPPEESDTAQRLAIYQAEGMRAWVESDYQRALTYLWRAEAVASSPRNLAFIARSYDMLGDCSSAERQLALMREQFPDADAPALQRCFDPASIRLECRFDDPIQIDDAIASRCGQVVRVPAGRHRLVVPARRISRQLELDAGQHTTVALRWSNSEPWGLPSKPETFDPTPTKWRPPRRPMKWGGVEVPRPRST